jgi:hypothetical protein
VGFSVLKDPDTKLEVSSTDTEVGVPDPLCGIVTDLGASYACAGALS